MNTTLRFASKIVFVSSEEFDKLPQKRLKKNKLFVGNPWRNKQQLHLVQEGYTNNAWACNAGGFINKNRLSLIHLFPNEEDDPPHELVYVPKAISDFKDDVAALRKKTSSLRGLLVAGRIHTKSSLNLRNVLISFFQEMKIPFSKLFGQSVKTGNYTSLYGSAKDDLWIVNMQGNKGKITQAAVEKYYQNVEIDPGDELILGAKVIVNGDQFVGIKYPNEK